MVRALLFAAKVVGLMVLFLFDVGGVLHTLAIITGERSFDRSLEYWTYLVGNTVVTFGALCASAYLCRSAWRDIRYARSVISLRAGRLRRGVADRG